MIKVAIVEDHRGQRESLAELLNTACDIVCVAGLASAEEAIERLPLLQPDVVLMDLQLPGGSGIEAIWQVASQLPQTRFLMLTVDDSRKSMFEALRAGATGYLLKRDRPGKILDCIREIHNGGVPMSAKVAHLLIENLRTGDEPHPDLEKLSPREIEVLRLLARGCQYKQIAEQLELRRATIDGYIKSIYKKLRVHSALEATRVLNRKGRDEGH